MPASLGGFREAKAVRANHHAVLQQYVVADPAVLPHHCMRMRKKIYANFHTPINDDMRQQHCIVPNLNVFIDHHIRPDVRIGPNSRARVHDRGRMYARLIPQRAVKQFERAAQTPNTDPSRATSPPELQGSSRPRSLPTLS